MYIYKHTHTYIYTHNYYIHIHITITSSTIPPINTLPASALEQSPPAEFPHRKVPPQLACRAPEHPMFIPEKTWR
jgi:hypothetical protein